MKFDCLVVGAGFAGAVLAERLASQLGKRVLICDKRDHVAGNAYDCLDKAGVLIHKYGPHIFHTAAPRVYQYLSQFTSWRPYEHRVIASVDGKMLPFPINVDTVNRLYNTNMSPAEVEAHFAKVAEPISSPRTSEDAVVSKVGRDLYEKFFENYTRKQWGLSPKELDALVAARVPARLNYDDRYFTDQFQAMPVSGYTAMFKRMLDHPNITVSLGTDYRTVKEAVTFDDMFFTGPIDEFFDYRFGPLPYRSIRFEFETHNRERFQNAAVINYPNEHAYTRITEFKYLTGQKHSKTTVVYEYPCDGGDPYYPVPRPENTALARQYKMLAAKTPRVSFVGRLATYQYYNMDQVVAQALATFEAFSKQEPRLAASSADGIRAA